MLRFVGSKRGQCRGCSHARSHLPRGSQLRQPKIKNLCVIALRHKNVGRLDVPVNDSLSVRGVQCISNLNPELQQFFDVQRFARDALLQRVALQQFHHDVGLAILLANLMNRADVGMVQRRGGPGFPLESFQRLPVFSQFFGEKLERNEAAQSGVFGLVDHTHPAATQLL